MSANDKDNPLEPFKRATIATMRALAENDELDVTFGHGTPAASGNRIRVPLPSVGSTDAQINVDSRRRRRIRAAPAIPRRRDLQTPCAA